MFALVDAFRAPGSLKEGWEDYYYFVAVRANMGVHGEGPPLPPFLLHEDFNLRLT